VTDYSQRLKRARAAYDRARSALFAEIKEALEAEDGPTVSQIARDADFTREYIAKIRDGQGPKETR
jgi:hypothetical protein